MQVSNPNNVKIYNLSAGKSLPEWLSERRRRTLLKQDVDIQRRIELIQDFTMPTVSNCISVSPDRNYVFTTGVYKPRVRCYDLTQMSMKFERCFDSEVIKFVNISEDWTKLIFLQADRYIEFHAQHGKYYKIRIPKNGRDLAYHHPSCDVYFVGASSEIYRLNLEQGRFLNSLKTDATEILCCEFNPSHQLFACGTKEGHVECWDPRTRNRVGKLDCAFSKLKEDHDIEGMPAVSCIKYKDGLTMGVGLSTGQILLYDIRSDRPLLVKDHMYGLPIKSMHFYDSQENIISIDQRIAKIWNRHTGKAVTSIEPETAALNDLAVYPDSGMFFMANEAPKLLTYYIPSLGPAPKWCSFLDSLTEELEENAKQTVYDDYKFLTRTELDQLGLTQHIGSNLLRAYMHGYFMDVRLYNKAKALAEPFAYEDYRRKKIAEKLEEARRNRVQVKKLPKINKALAEKLLVGIDINSTKRKAKQTTAAGLLQDDRFKDMFHNPDFQVDPESEEYRFINPVVSKMDKAKKKKIKAMEENFEEIQTGMQDQSDSSDDEHTWKDKTKNREGSEDEDKSARNKPRFFALKDGTEASALHGDQKKRKNLQKRALGDRLADHEDRSIISQRRTASGGMEMTFQLKQKKTDSRWKEKNQEHHAERRKIRRSTAGIIKPKHNPHFSGGRR